MKKILFLALVCVSSMFAKQIESIKFSGLVHLSSEIAEDITGLKVGDELNAENIDKAIKNLFKQNYFEDIVVEENDGEILFVLKEKPTIARVELDGVGENDKEAVKSILGVSKGMVYDDLSINRAKEKIRQFYEAKGYFDSVVETRNEELESGSLKVTFFVNRGENIIIRSVELCGANTLSYSDIEPAIANKEREFMGWMWGLNDGKVKLFDLPSDSDRIKDEYYKRGFLDAKVSTPYLKFYNDSYNAKLSYHISEGEIYKVSSIKIEMDEKVFFNNELEDELKLSVGKTMSSEKLRKDITMMETKVADLGYAFVRVYPDVRQNKEKQEVDIVYRIQVGDKVRINNVIISGNTKTIDKIIRRELYLTEGELYSRTNLNDSKNALKRTGYFDEVEIKEERVTQKLVDLVVSVKEGSTGDITGGIGYGSSDGLLLNASVSDVNIFGSGLKGSISVDRSDNELSGRISLSNPRVFDSVYSLGGSIYVEEDEWQNYKETNKGFNINVGRKLGRYTNVNLGYILEESDISGLDQSLLDIGYRNGKTLKSAVVPSVKFDNTDDYYLPRSGIIASASLEYAGLGGDEEFISNFYKFNAYYGLADWIGYDLILRYKARLGFVIDEGLLPISERIYLGGISSIRGYESRSISPKNEKGYLIGGKKVFNNSFELSFPLVKRLKMRSAFFFDYGMIGNNNFDEIQRASAGLSIEWVTPLGPLQLIFSEPFMNKDGDDISRFEFSIGRRF